MKTQVTAWMLLLLFAAALPTAADDRAKEDAGPKEDTILGTWYLQVMEDELVPIDEGLRIVFGEDGVATAYEGNDNEDVAGYTLDKKRGTITIHEEDDPTDIEVVLKYRYVDDILVLSYKEDEDDEDEEVMELTRNPEGAKRHQAMRKGERDVPDLPDAADDNTEGAGDLPEEDTILGTWHVQVMEGELMPEDESIRIIFKKDGTVFVYEGDREEEAGGYLHNEERAEIKIFEDNDPTDIEAILKYSFVDDMLVMHVIEDPGQGRENDEQVIELTRNPEGTERHQAMRAKRGDKPGPRERMRRMAQMRQLFMAAMAYSLDQNNMPASIGDLVVGEYIELQAALPASAKEKLPKDFGEWKGPARRDWINQNAGCVFLKFDLKAANTDKLVAIFDVPTKDQEQVTLIFGDGHAELLALEEADKRIKTQTGTSLAQWAKSKSPGSGAVPEDEAAAKN